MNIELFGVLTMQCIQQQRVHFFRIGYNFNVMQKSQCLVSNPIGVNLYAALFNFTLVKSGVRLYDGLDLKIFILVGWVQSFFVCSLAHRD